MAGKVGALVRSAAPATRSSPALVQVGARIHNESGRVPLRGDFFLATRLEMLVSVAASLAVVGREDENVHSRPVGLIFGRVDKEALFGARTMVQVEVDRHVQEAGGIVDGLQHVSRLEGPQI
jgi:hypothetical protein